MSDYPELQPIPLRDETSSNYQKAAWKPNYKCFCCHDQGWVTESLVKKVIPNYIGGNHKPLKCNATGCDIQLGEYLYQTNTLDTRFTSEICDRLDQDEREMWIEWSRQQHEKRKSKVDFTNATNNLRARARLSHEHLEAQRRHSDIRIR